MVVEAFLIHTCSYLPSGDNLFRRGEVVSSNSPDMAENQLTSALAAEDDDSDWEYEYHETETEVSESCLQCHYHCS